MLSRQPRPRKCAWCSERFEPRQMGQRVCSVACSIAYNRAEAAKDAHRSKPTRKHRTLSGEAELTQRYVNQYVRLRDSGKPCISCDKPDNGNHQRHASHFRSVGAASHLRFNVLNVHASCATCNSVLSGNLLEYMKRLPDKIGQDKTDWLLNANFEKRYSIDYAKRVKSIFTKRTRLYKKLFR